MPEGEDNSAAIAEPSRVFVSYSYDSDEHVGWVEQFATRLRSSGVNARLDKWHREGRDLPAFMTSEVRQARWVLAVCTPTYRYKVHQMEDGKATTGTGIEFGQGAMHAWSENRQKMIPVLRSGTQAESVPDMIRGQPFYDLTRGTDGPEFSRLVGALIYGPPPAPAMGAPPSRAPYAAAACASSGVSFPPLLEFCVDRAFHREEFEGRLEEVLKADARARLLHFLTSAPTNERADTLIDSLREYSLKEQTEAASVPSAIEIIVDWPSPKRSLEERRQLLGRSLGQALKKKQVHGEHGERSAGQLICGLNRSVLVRTRIAAAETDSSELELIRHWIATWSEIARSIDLDRDSTIDRVLIVVCTFLEFSETKSVFWDFGRKRRMARLVQQLTGLSQKPGLVATPPLEPVPLGTIPKWLDLVGKQLEDRDLAERSSRVEAIRGRVKKVYDFEASGDSSVAMSTLAPALREALQEGSHVHADP